MNGDHRELRKEQSLNYKDPETPITLKTAKKSFINWLVPTLCVAVLMAIFTVAKSWADDRYPLKKNVDTAFAETVQHLADEQKERESAIKEEQQKREAIEAREQEIIRKLDLILYIEQQQGKLDPQSMKGKLTPP